MPLLVVLGDEVVADDRGERPPGRPSPYTDLLRGAVWVKNSVYIPKQLYRFFARSPPSAPSMFTNFIGSVEVKAFGVVRRASS